MPIKLDSSPSGVVVYCTDCDHWAESAGDRLEGARIANTHERGVHPDQTFASSNLSQLQTRLTKKKTSMSRL